MHGGETEGVDGDIRYKILSVSDKMIDMVRVEIPESAVEDED